MAETLLFEYEVPFGEVDGTISVTPAPFVLSLNETYRVVWGTDTYVCVAAEATDDELSIIWIGNGQLISGADNGIPFIVAYDSDQDMLAAISIYDPSATVNVAIYHIEEDKNIILLDRQGVAVPYEGVTTVQLHCENGDVQVFTPGEPQTKNVEADFSEGDMTIKPDTGMLLTEVTIPKPDTLLPENILDGIEIAGVEGTATIPQGEELTISPDFSNGNIVATPNDGYMYSKITVQQPETLIPENIAEGVDIAGIIGTLTAGSGGGVQLFSGNIKGSPATIGSRIDVDFGFKPDFILFHAHSTVSSYAAVVRWGFSAAAKAALAPTITMSQGSLQGSSVRVSIYSGAIDDATTTQAIYNADETGFNIGSVPDISGTYYCIAFKLF